MKAQTQEKGAFYNGVCPHKLQGRTYILHSRETTLRNGRQQTLYFFAKEAKEGTLDAVPEGYEVSESKNGLPVLKRSK